MKTEEDIIVERIQLFTQYSMDLLRNKYTKDYYIEFLTRSNELHKKFRDLSERLKTADDDKEKEELLKEFYECQAELDLLKILNTYFARLRDKADRKCLESEKRYEQFCKRHNIEEE